MHELSIAQALVGQIESVIEQERIERLLAVTIQVGALSGVEKHALEMAFPIAVENAGLDPIELIVEKVPAAVRCNQCGHAFSPETPLFLCEKCDSAEVEISAGRELAISSMRIERRPHS